VELGGRQCGYDLEIGGRQTVGQRTISFPL
jgi:hypothetical protein